MALCDSLNPRFLNVSTSHAANPEFHLVHGKVTSWLGLVDADTDFKNLIVGFRQCPTNGTARTLDLISHSVDSERFLALGSWIIGDGPGDADITFFHELLQDLQHLRIGRIRLLGCETAWSAAGRSTVEKLGAALGIETCGTRRLLIESDFRPEGLNLTPGDDPNAQDDPTRCSTPARPLPAGEPDVPHPVFPEQARRVKPLDLDEVPPYTALELESVPGVTWPQIKLARPLTRTQEEDIHGLVGDVNRGAGRSLPGLLLAPSHEYWIPVAGHENTYRLVHHLYSWNLLRVYSRKLATVPIPPHATHYTVVNPYDSAVYRVARPKALEALMTALPGTPLPARIRSTRR